MKAIDLIERLLLVPEDSEVFLAGAGDQRIGRASAVELYLCGKKDVVIHPADNVPTPGGVSEIVRVD